MLLALRTAARTVALSHSIKPIGTRTLGSSSQAREYLGIKTVNAIQQRGAGIAVATFFLGELAHLSGKGKTPKITGYFKPLSVPEASEEEKQKAKEEDNKRRLAQLQQDTKDAKRAKVRREQAEAVDSKNTYLEKMQKNYPSWLKQHEKEEAKLVNEEIDVKARPVLDDDMVIIPGPVGHEQAVTQATTVALEDSGKKKKIEWKRDHPGRIKQALALWKELGGVTAGVALKHLQASEVLNADKLFDSLPRSTLSGWKKDLDEKHHGDMDALCQVQKPNRLPNHMTSPVHEETKKRLLEQLDKLGAAGATLTTTSMRNAFKVIIDECQPSLLTSGTFSMSDSWIAGFCHKNGYTMQRKTTKALALPENWQDLGRTMALRLAYYVSLYDIPRELVVGADETPVKTTPNANVATRHKANSGDVFGLGVDDKMQITATPLISAAGLLGAPSAKELAETPELAKAPALKTQLIFSGKSRYASGPNEGKTRRTACPMAVASSYPEFTFAQTPSHFARFESVEQLLEENLVPYFEAMIEKLGLVGEKKIKEVKADGTYDPEVHEHQRCVLKWDVYAVHREERTMEWIKNKFPWILLLFVPARCTSKLQELDVGVNSHIQAGSKTAMNDLEVQRLMKLRADDAEATLKLDITPSQRKRDVLALLAAGMKKARALGTATLRALFAKTGLDRAWDKDFQQEALKLHVKEKLFFGTRKEDAPLGQEPAGDVEDEVLGTYPGAPPKPIYKYKSPRTLYIMEKRGEIKDQHSCKTLGEATKIAESQWANLPPAEQQVYKKKKDAIYQEYQKTLKDWQETIAEMRRAAAAMVEGEEDEEDEDEDEDEEDEEDDELDWDDDELDEVADAVTEADAAPAEDAVMAEAVPAPEAMPTPRIRFVFRGTRP